MRNLLLVLLATAALGAAFAVPASAQSGFALKGHYIVNSSAAQSAQETRELPSADGIGLGAELVLPLGIGVGISGYTAREADDAGFDTREFTVVGEANYFVSLPILPLSGYAGVHAGLGVLDRDEVSDPQLRIEDRSRSQLGYQVGVRFQPTSLIGLDAQWRRMSTSAASGQSGRLERDQVLIGVTLF